MLNVCVYFVCVCVEVDELQFNASPDEFTSKKVTTKILQQIEVRKHMFSLSLHTDLVSLATGVPLLTLALSLSLSPY